MDYELIRSKRKTMALEIRQDGSVVVRAPFRVGVAAIEDFVSRHQFWLKKHLARRAEQLIRHPEPTPEEEARLRTLAKIILPQRVTHFAGLLGFTPAGVKITSARTRFGSCSAKNSLCFSWRLMAYPMEAVDYVVVHELCHIVHKNHQKEFYNLVASVFPDYSRRKALLRA